MGKWKIANILETSSRRAKRSEILTWGVAEGRFVQLLKLWPIMLKYGTFENRPVSRKPLPVERK